MAEPWWKSAVVYQIYPRSFADSDGDGIGDLSGIRARLDHLEALGADVIWLSPIYPSPQDDNGYDIADYRDIEPVFGTLDAFDALLADVHARGMRLIMDLVVNHTSDEHPWFVESRSSQGQPEARLVLVARAAQQLGLGVLGLRLGARRGDRRVLPAPVLAQAARPQLGEPGGPRGRLLDDELVAGPRGRRLPHGRHQHDLQGPGAARRVGRRRRLAARRRRALHLRAAHPRVPAGDAPRGLRGRDALLNVGEMPGVTIEEAKLFTDPARDELDMVFQFEHVNLDQRGTKWNSFPLDLRDLKRSFGRWQEGLAETGWNSLYWNNHDQPRIVSRWGDDGEHRVRSAKALGTLLHLHRGTPYVYQGEELGMTNVPFDSIEAFRDIESLNHYAEAVAAGDDPDAVLATMRPMSRDNARTPMQWDGSPHAGFTTGEPWIPVNPNHTEINAEAAVADPDSVFHHYRRLIELRHAEPAVAYGDFTMLLEDDPQVYAFTREHEGTELLVLVNVSGEPASAAGIPDAERVGRRRARAHERRARAARARARRVGGARSTGASAAPRPRDPPASRSRAAAPTHSASVVPTRAHSRGAHQLLGHRCECARAVQPRARRPRGTKSSRAIAQRDRQHEVGDDRGRGGEQQRRRRRRRRASRCAT